MAFEKGNEWQFKKGPGYWKGKKFSEEHKEKLSKSHKGQHNSIKTEFKRGHELNDKGYGSLNYKLRRSVDWKTWREAVFKRDNYTCLKCGKRGCMLHPHHIVPVKECLLLDYQELIFDVDNGNTLCKDCHIGKGLHGGGSNF